jgi:hypothetical protein
VVVHGAEDDSRAPLNAQRRFHFDYAGWQSLNLFMYLTDVEPDSGAHEVLAGTHRAKRLRDAVRPRMPDEEVAARFGDRIRTISGPAGILFFEDVEAFHRRRIMKRRRAMLNVLWASHRGFLSHGRLAPRHSDYLKGPAAAAPGG